MDVIETLKEVRRQDERLKRFEQKYSQEMFELYNPSAPSLSERVQSSNQTDLCDRVVKLERLRERVNEEWDKLIDARAAAVKLIHREQDSQIREILYKRYIEYRKFDDIGKELNISTRWIYKLHNRGIQDIT